MKQFLMSLAATLVLGAAILAPAPAYAWATGQSAGSKCDGAKSVISWTFKNTEQDKAKWSMDVVVKDSGTNQSQGPFTVKGGQSTNGTFVVNGPVKDGTITYELTWTDGRSGVDKRTSKYDSTSCKEEPKLIEVCRDGKVITIKESERKDGDTNPPCPVEMIKVCRDGVIIEIKPEDRKSTDTDACVLSEEHPKELPNTGIESVFGGLIGASALAYGARELISSKRNLRHGLLNR